MRVWMAGVNDVVEIFLAELFVITFSEAVKRGLLVDYKVIVLAIEEALRRIKDNAYGICECGCQNCEGEIGLGRLKVMPFTRLCVKCQEETERENKLQRKLDEERNYPKLSITDAEEDTF